MRMFDRRQIWEFFIGKDSEFPLESRVFHSICLIGLAALLYNIPFNYYIGLPVVSLLSFIMLSVVAGLYYLSRIRLKSNIAIVGLAVMGNVLFVINYYLNAGIDGPTALLFVLFFYLMMATVPKKNNWVWLMTNIVLVMSLMFTQYLYPDTVPKTYVSEFDRYTDMSSAYIVVVVLIYFTLAFIRKNYDQEKQSVSENSLAIERKNQELEILNAEKNKLFSIVAHDLRSPLSSVQSYLELLGKESVNEDERKDIEDRLLTLTRNTNNMMANLLSWSKSQMEGVKAQIEKVNLLKNLNQILDLEQVIAMEKGIKLHYEINGSIFIRADRNMLQLVVRNLVSNAIKFTSADGEIYISALVTNGECKICVRDNGEGISVEQQKSVFSLQAKSTFGTNNEKGVGLGLLLCKEFTELQGGTIGFESKMGLGSTFFICMPIEEVFNAPPSRSEKRQID